MGSLQNKYQKTAILLEDCRTFASFSLGQITQPKFHNCEFTLLATKFIASNNKKNRKDIINHNDKRIKLLKQRLKDYSYRFEIENSLDSVVNKSIKNDGEQEVGDFIKLLIKQAKIYYENRNKADKPLYNSLANNPTKEPKKLISISGRFGKYTFKINPFSIYEDKLNEYTQYINKKS